MQRCAVFPFLQTTPSTSSAHRVSNTTPRAPRLLPVPMGLVCLPSIQSSPVQAASLPSQTAQCSPLRSRYVLSVPRTITHPSLPRAGQCAAVLGCFLANLATSFSRFSNTALSKRVASRVFAFLRFCFFKWFLCVFFWFFGFCFLSFWFLQIL